MATPAFESRHPSPEQQSAPRPDDERHFHHTDHDFPRMEPWLGMMLSSSLAIPLALFVPASFATVVFVVAGALIITGIIMLIAQERRTQRTGP